MPVLRPLVSASGDAMKKRYEVDGVEYPSVTQIINQLDKSEGLLPWASRCAVDYICNNLANLSGEILDQAVLAYKTVNGEAKDIGTAVHDLIEKNVVPVVDEVQYDEIYTAFCAYQSWRDEHIDEFLMTEQFFYDKYCCFAGTLDAVVRMKDGRILVIDYKTSNGFYDGYDLQLAAYRYLYENTTGGRIDGQAILRLDKKTGKPEFKEYKEYKIDAFIKLLDFFYAYKKRRFKNNPRSK